MLKFGITGFLNTFIDFGVFNLLVYLTGIDSGVKLGLINALAVALAATNSYLLNRNWTFKGKEPTAEQPVFDLSWLPA
jgi:putative flippase GtrA